MPVTKTTPKKTAKKTARKAARVTIDEVWATIAEMHAVHKETEKGLLELKASQVETAKGLLELKDSHKEIAKGLLELKESHKETAKELLDLKKSQVETERILREAIAETDRTLREAIGETDRTLREAIAETDKALRAAFRSTEKTLNKAIGGLGNTMGALVEKFMTAGLPEKFKQYGFSFNQVTTVKWADGENNIYTEIDGLLENGTQAMTVEVKTTLRTEDIDDHLIRMDRVRAYANIHSDKREFLGAIAATIVDKSVREYALKKGFFVIEPSGEAVKITKPAAAAVW
jgi:hypothetical protein